MLRLLTSWTFGISIDGLEILCPNLGNGERASEVLKEGDEMEWCSVVENFKTASFVSFKRKKFGPIWPNVLVPTLKSVLGLISMERKHALFY